ncbi:MAG: class I SAM-dependent methyltransferase [Chlorobiaceae bacterium]|nr:class I SAM-dependent methyltransferase [Chlorobiaceae bacterium]
MDQKQQSDKGGEDPTTLFRDYFSTVSSNYALFRPSYPDTLFAWLASVAPARRMAWDCATGSGQAAAGLVAYFERVVATDASQAQIQGAVLHPRVEYRVALADASGLNDRSVDLVTVAQALHWFDMERFYDEVRRVLVADGVLVVWCYGPLVVEGEEINAIVRRFYDEVVGPFWPAERAIVDDGYREISLPFTRIDVPVFDMSVLWNLHDLLGYISTWSATARFIQATGIDPVLQLGRQLSERWGQADDRKAITWPMVVQAGRA